MSSEQQNIREEFQWTFEVNDVVKFEGTQVTVYSDSYDKAIRKVKSLKLPSLRTFDDIEGNLKLTEVYEIIQESGDVSGYEDTVHTE